MIDEINQYCWKNKNKPLTIQKIKEEVWKDNKNSDPPSNSTIAKILKTKLMMNYRTLTTRHPKSVLAENNRKFIEASILQLQLSKQLIQLIYIVEFHLT